MLKDEQFNFLQEKTDVKVLKSEFNGVEVVGGGEKNYNMNEV
jgi:hypothetical protein